MSSIFTESGDKKIAKPQESILKSLKNKHNPYNDTSYPETSDEKPKISKELVVAGLDPQSNIDKCKYDRGKNKLLFIRKTHKIVKTSYIQISI